FSRVETAKATRSSRYSSISKLPRAASGSSSSSSGSRSNRSSDSKASAPAGIGDSMRTRSIAPCREETFSSTSNSSPAFTVSPALGSSRGLAPQPIQLSFDADGPARLLRQPLGGSGVAKRGRSEDAPGAVRDHLQLIGRSPEAPGRRQERALSSPDFLP